MANFLKCFKCNVLAPTTEQDRKEETNDEDGEETITYTRE